MIDLDAMEAATKASVNIDEEARQTVLALVRIARAAVRMREHGNALSVAMLFALRDAGLLD